MNDIERTIRRLRTDTMAIEQYTTHAVSQVVSLAGVLLEDGVSEQSYKALWNCFVFLPLTEHQRDTLAQLESRVEKVNGRLQLKKGGK